MLASILAGNDTIVLSASDDRFEGFAGNDRMWGHGGNDTLIGGGAPTCCSAVRIRFATCSFSALVRTQASGRSATGSSISAPGQDDIDLSLIDAHTGRPGNQGFAFSGTKAAAHSVWYVKHADGILVRGDVNGNKTADLEISVDDVGRLGANDVIL